ncbi:hypothetical protein NDU88_005301 [Pleurodeles waltl]|uniref:Uncharacterized protein n=1 Tax=Pleurodeles waltl TaxID=8319 RepID=A0AAV7VL46_PLEWA|nr:hypothetical protein NDU88_005301 [Pleurodeles waltl]
MSKVVYRKKKTAMEIRSKLKGAQAAEPNNDKKKGWDSPLGCKWAVEKVDVRLHKLYLDSEELFDIMLMTNNHDQVGMRLKNSINR